MNYILKAIDTFDLDSESFIVGEYSSKEEAIKSINLRTKRHESNKGNTFYKYFIEDNNGERIELGTTN